MEDFIRLNKKSEDPSDIQKIDRFNEYLSESRKYRQYQKRFRYTKDEFENYFDVMVDKIEVKAKETEVYFDEKESKLLFKWNNHQHEVSYTGDVIESAKSEFKRFLTLI